MFDKGEFWDYSDFMAKLASIEIIKEILLHSNADSLVLARVLGYTCIIRKDSFKVNDKVCFISPDTILPDKPWATVYKAKFNRVKAIRLRSVWSEGLIESLDTVECPIELRDQIGLDIADKIGVAKYEAKVPQNLDAKGFLPFGIPKTDEDRFESLDFDPMGQECWVTIKKDGSSMSVYCKKEEDGEFSVGVTSRSLDLKLDSDNPWTRAEKKYDVINKLKEFCGKENKSLVIRGELTGNGLNDSKPNPDSKLPLEFWVYNIWDINERRYWPLNYVLGLCKEWGFKYVPIVEHNSHDKPLLVTPELIKRYAEDINDFEGKPYEGVVIKLIDGTSFKVINKSYDSQK